MSSVVAAIAEWQNITPKCQPNPLITPWPYCDPRFASWEEADGTLVTDPANFVIRHSTSYCAWRIRELTGKWPTNRVKPRNEAHAQEIRNRERPHDAKYWLEFLQAQDCYLGVVDADYITQHPNHHYIGVDPNCGEYGLVIWFENLAYDIQNQRTLAVVSTYRNQCYLQDSVHFADFTWVKIGKRAAP